MFHCWYTASEDGSEGTVNCRVFDFERGEWRSVQSLSGFSMTRSGIHCASNKIYLGGGMSSEQMVRCYDLKCDRWTALPDTVHSHSESPAIWSDANGDMLFIAGNNSYDAGSVEMLDLRDSASKWTVAPEDMQISSYFKRQHDEVEIRRVFV